jgi:hypothetical protein
MYAKLSSYLEYLLVAVLTVFGWFCVAEMAAQVQRRLDFWQQQHDDASSDFDRLCVRLFA